MVLAPPPPLHQDIVSRVPCNCQHRSRRCVGSGASVTACPDQSHPHCVCVCVCVCVCGMLASLDMKSSKVTGQEAVQSQTDEFSAYRTSRVQLHSLVSCFSLCTTFLYTHRQTEILLKDFKVFVGYRCSLDSPPAEVGVAWETKFELYRWGRPIPGSPHAWQKFPVLQAAESWVHLESGNEIKVKICVV